MTHVNLIPPSELCDQHLLAEHRGIERIPNKLISGEYDLRGQPDHYVLGTGHIKFFYTRLGFLFRRYCDVFNECEARGFKVQWMWPVECELLHQEFFHDYQPTTEEVKLSRSRIQERMPKKPRFTQVSTLYYPNINTTNS